MFQDGSVGALVIARLAAEATTVINAGDYGRTIYELAIRRQLIGVGEDLVNVAYDAPVDDTTTLSICKSKTGEQS